jgi:predicted nucleic acid-binding protein
VAFRVVYDANVLYPSYLRDVLIRVAQAGLVQAKWSDRILDETFGNLRSNRPDLDPVKLSRTRELMCRAIPDCLVIGYEPLIEAVELPDKDDRHVLAAAIKAQAQLIVTDNLKDFPADALAGWNVEAQSPDEFLHDLIDLDPQAVYGAVQRIADSMKNPPGTVDDVLASLEREGLVETVAALRR